MSKSPKVLNHRFTLVMVVVENLRSLFMGVRILRLKWILVVIFQYIFHNPPLGHLQPGPKCYYA